MAIPVGTMYTTTLSAKAAKVTSCEHCQRDYVYIIERTATGEEMSLFFLDNQGARTRSHEQAQKALTEALMRQVDPVPCPRCGWYQELMVVQLRFGYRAWLQWAGGGVIGLAVVLMIATFICIGLDPSQPANTTTWGLGGAAAACFILGIAVILYHGASAARYDPNAEPQEKRIARGRIRAVAREEYEQEHAEPNTELS